MSDDERELDEIRSREYVRAADPWERISRLEALAERLIEERAQLRADLAEAVRLLRRALTTIEREELWELGEEVWDTLQDTNAFLARFPEDRG